MYTTYIGNSGHTNETITLLKDGRLFTQGYTSSNRGITWEKSIGYVSTDGGYNWSEENIGRAIPHSNIRLHDGRLMAAFRDPQPENVIAAGLNGTTYSIGYSDDDGLTWTDMHPLTNESGCFYVMNNRFLRLKSGRILLSIARHPNEDFGKKIEEAGVAGTAYTDDEGRTWKFSNWIGGNVQEPMAVETESGRLLLFLRTTRGYLYTCESYDEGETWCNETCTGIKMPTAPFTISKDPYSGYVFLVWIDSFPGPDRSQYPRSPLKMAVSRDNCRSFQTVMTLDDNSNKNYGYPAMFFTPDRILVNYYENPESRKYQYEKHIIKLRILERSELTFDMTVKVPLFPG